MTKEQFIEKKLASPERESKFGYHFIMDYAENPYHFFLRYVLGIRRSKKGKALLFGGAIHDAIHSFYETNDPDAPIETFLAVLDSVEYLYEESKDYKKDIDRGQMMLHQWLNVVPAAEQEDELELVEAEVPHDIKLLNGFPMTIRIDRVMYHPGMMKYLLREVKTTGWSIDGMYDSVKRADQITTYVIGASRAGLAKAADILVSPEILYNRQSVVKVQHPSFIFRSPSELYRTELSLISWFGRLYNSLKMYQEGAPAPLAFPRNGTTNRKFSQELEGLMDGDWRYIEELAKSDTLPEWYELDPRVVEEDFLKKEFMPLWESTKDFEEMKELLP